MSSIKPSILVVSPDAKLRGHLAGILAFAGYSVTATESFDSLRQPATAGNTDLVILALAGLDDTVPALARDVAQAVGELIVVAEPSAIARLTLLDSKVDAYIAKPFTEFQLLAQVARLLGRGQSGRAELTRAGAFLAFEGFTLDIPGHSLFNPGGQEVELTRAEFALLVALLIPAP
ncbi:MAG: hypothetical protein E6H66_24465 [Betaproteobacteria bacterium]|nr:MAG: hypothetical protein E6H66_24465 [Betaproteobacteria bacterium]